MINLELITLHRGYLLICFVGWQFTAHTAISKI